MNQFEIKPSISIPYFDHSDRVLKTIGSSAKRRGINPLFFLIKKVVNVCLFRMTFFCPLNKLRLTFHRWRGVMIGVNVYIGMQCTIDNAYPE
jgi:hypothetical protein